jgi:hypothetical protein
MSPARFNRLMRRQLDRFLREEQLGFEQHATLAAFYPVRRWDWLSLGRWFAVFGALSATAGVNAATNGAVTRWRLPRGSC